MGEVLRTTRAKGGAEYFVQPGGGVEMTARSEGGTMISTEPKGE